jgi:spore germination protein GerM
MSAARGLALALVTLCGCGVQAQDGPERLPPELLPPELRRSAEPTASSLSSPVATTVPVYLVEDGRLVRQEQPAQGRTVEQALVRLMTAADAQGRRRSAVPPGTVVQRLDVRGQVLVVELSAPFAQVRGRDQVLAVAQVVWTATEFPAVRRVDVRVEGRRIDLPVERGAVSAGPASREDYRSVGPAR